jgi:hypothetical protein
VVGAWAAPIAAVAALSAAALAAGAAAPGSVEAPSGDPFASLPVAAPGVLPGRIAYVNLEDCGLREFDLSTGNDEVVRAGSQSLCFAFLAPDGRLAAARLSDNTIALVHVDGRRTVLGPASPRLRPPGAMVTAPIFSPDSSRVAYCTYTKRAMTTFIATATGEPIGRVHGTCEVAFTAKGIAALRGGRVELAGRTIFRLRHAIPANTHRGNSGYAEGTTLAANRAGTRLALVARTVKHGGRSSAVVIHLLRLDGHEVARLSGQTDLPLSFQAFAPGANSAVLWWADILQLAPFSPGHFALRYHTKRGIVYADHAVAPVTYSPDGAYAFMPRYAVRFRRQPEPPPLDAVVFAAGTFQPLYRIPLKNVRGAVWLPD